MLWILMAKEGTTIAVVAGIFGASNFENQNEVGELYVLDQSDVVWAAYFGLVVANAFVESKGFLAIFLMERPRCIVGSFPIVASLFKVVAEDQRHSFRFVVGLSECQSSRNGCNGNDGEEKAQR